MFEAVEILAEAPLICALMKPLRELVSIRSRQIRVARIFCEFNDGLRPQNSVQVLM